MQECEAMCPMWERACPFVGLGIKDGAVINKCMYVEMHQYWFNKLFSGGDNEMP